MAGQRPQLTVERAGKKGPASAPTVGFRSLPKFAPPSALLSQMGEWVDVDRERGDGRQMRGLACSKMPGWFGSKTHPGD